MPASAVDRLLTLALTRRRLLRESLAGAALIALAAACSRGDDDNSDEDEADEEAEADDEEGADDEEEAADEEADDATEQPTPAPFTGTVPSVATSATIPTPRSDHPRLWIRTEDLPRLRALAVDANPAWGQGLALLGDQMRDNMDDGYVDDDAADTEWDEFPTESYARVFALLSLIHPDEGARADYTERARKLLMRAIDAAAEGPDEDEPFRHPDFQTSDSNRSRWWGECFALTVDWIYPALSSEDKQTIRAVFLRWCQEIVEAGYHTPEPFGLLEDPALLADRELARWALNNYFTAHMRNMGLMALALDEADDPGGELRAYLDNAIGARLYMVDDQLQGDSRGGLAPEGFEYSPQTLAYLIQFLLALYTAGVDDPTRYGQKVVLTGHPFLDALLPTWFASVAPVPVEREEVGRVYELAFYGDGLKFETPDMIATFGPLALHALYTGDEARVDAIRWMAINQPPGGAATYLERIGDTDLHENAVLHFLIADPTVTPADPRPAQPLRVVAPGMGRFMARTTHDADARWFCYKLSWNTIDHQHDDGNHFDFWRKGEWLTKERLGYGINNGLSHWHNTLSLENDEPEDVDIGQFVWKHGSQWPLTTPESDPHILATSSTDDWLYIHGDATGLYNHYAEGATDVTHASRAIIWLVPDNIVVYDHAATGKEDRFKRFWLQLPQEPELDSGRATMTTPAGQTLVVTTLLPSDADISTGPADAGDERDELAENEPMGYRLRVEAPGGPAEATFLHVLQALDAGQPVDEARYIDGDAVEGAAFGARAVLFVKRGAEDPTEVGWSAPSAATTLLVTGLAPGSAWDVATVAEGDDIRYTLTPGSALVADDGGVLRIDA